MKKRIIISFLVILIFTAAVVISNPLNLNFRGALESIGTNPLLLISILIAFSTQLFGHLIRSTKHKMILEQIRPVKNIEIFKGQTIGFLFNSILPLRLGELFRAHYIAKGVSVSRSAVFATILFERLIDMLFLIIAGLIMMLLLDLNSTWLSYVTIVLSAGVIVLGFVLYSARSQKKWLLNIIYCLTKTFNDNIKNRIRLMCWSAIYVLKNTITKRIMPKYLVQTTVMWLLYFISTYSFIAIAFNQLGFNQQISSSIAAYFGVSIPSGPAYLGTFQQVFTAISGVPADFLHDQNITLFIWLILVGPTTILGLIFLISPQKIYSKKHKDIISALRNKLYRDVDITDEFAIFLDAYFKGDEINRILTSEEHAKNFQVIKTFTGGSNALTILAWQDNRMIVKKITLKQYQDKLSAQYEWLNDRQELPEIASPIAQHLDDDNYYAIDIEYMDDYSPFFDIIHSSSEKTNRSILLKVCRFTNNKIYRPIRILEKKEAEKYVNEYIESKVIGKIVDSANINLSISNLLNHETIVVNGRNLRNFYAIIEKIRNNKKAMSDLCEIHESPIHGDLTVDNIIVNPSDNKFIILDPNNENTISDAVVDYGKLMQSLHSGYEFLRSLTSCNVKNNNINFKEIRSNQYNKLYDELNEYLKINLSAKRYRTVLFHEAVHYCRMLTYRCEINPDTAAAFYCIAIRLFNDFMEQYEN